MLGISKNIDIFKNKKISSKEDLLSFHIYIWLLISIESKNKKIKRLTFYVLIFNKKKKKVYEPIKHPFN